MEREEEIKISNKRKDESPEEKSKEKKEPRPFIECERDSPPWHREFFVSDYERRCIFRGVKVMKQFTGSASHAVAVAAACGMYMKHRLAQDHPKPQECTREVGALRYMRLSLYGDQILVFEDALRWAQCPRCPWEGCALARIFATVMELIASEVSK